MPPPPDRLPVVSAMAFPPRTALEGLTAVPLVLMLGCVGSATDANQAPVVSIAAPVDGSQAAQGEAVTFEGSASDPDGGSVSVAWESSIDGPFATRLTATTDALSPGSHTITLRARDEDGANASASIALIVKEVTRWTSLDVGAGFTCGATLEGAGYCWGSGRYGRLGNGSEDNRSVPTSITGGHTWTQLSAGALHTCGLTIEGDAYCWGIGQDGQLGNGSREASSTPVRVSGGHTWKRVTVGTDLTCGITTEGDAYCWGRGAEGQLGSGFQPRISTPTLVGGSHTWVDLNAGSWGSGFDHVCGITSAADTYCWGRGDAGELGNGANSNSDTPVPVSGPMKWQKISVGAQHACGITTEGDAYCWGDASRGQLGSGSTVGTNIPTAVAGSFTWTEISAGGDHTCGITSDGVAHCWGDGIALGNTSDLGVQPDSPTPVRVIGSIAWAEVSAGSSHTCGLTQDARAYCWGAGEDGQLGQGRFSGSRAPVPVAPAH